MLNEERLAKKIENVFDRCQQENDNPDSSKTLLAREIAKAVVEEIKELQITYVNGLTTTAGPVTGTIAYKLE